MIPYIVGTFGFLTSIPQCVALHGSTRGVLEPGIESEFYVAGSGDCV